MRDLRQLRFFVTVAELMNVSRAAEALNISQSALSRQLQALEEEIGLRLFDRVGKRLVLTAEGEEMLPRVAGLVEQAEALSIRAVDVARGRIGRLRIGSTPQTIAALIAPALKAFRIDHPLIEVALLEGANRELIEMVERGAVHVAIAGSEDPNAFGSAPLFSAELLAYLPPNDRRAKASALPLEALKDMPFLLLRRGFMTREMFDYACRKLGIRPRIVLESDSPHALVAMVEAGHGVAILSSSAANGIRSNPPVPVTLEGRRIHRPVSAIWNLERHRPASLPAFVACLQNAVRSASRPRRTINADHRPSRTESVRGKTDEPRSRRGQKASKPTLQKKRGY
jgi:DNA-binding transcriptional LysR family regulator